jgi:hypothetical protein
MGERETHVRAEAVGERVGRCGEGAAELGREGAEALLADCREDARPVGEVLTPARRATSRMETWSGPSVAMISMAASSTARATSMRVRVHLDSVYETW